MLEKLNKENLNLIRNYLPQVVMCLLTAAVIRLQLDVYASQDKTDAIRAEQVKFEREVNSKVLLQLSQNTDAMNEMKTAIQIFLKSKER